MELQLYSKSNNENIDIDNDIMRRSLSSITQEIQKFHFYNDAYPKNDIFEIIKKYKSGLKIKNRQMKKLSENIKIACIVAKTAVSAKERESKSNKDLIDFFQNESALVIKRNQSLQIVVKELTKENTILFNKIDSLQNFIKLGYENVQNIRNEPVENLTLFSKFQKILVSFGQYYADFYNEHEKCKQLEQKIRFYQNKLWILEKNFKIVTDELKNLRHQNMKLQRQKYYYKQNGFRSFTPIVYCKDILRKDINKSNLHENVRITDILGRESKQQFDLSSHLILVKNLLSDQDSMIQNLNYLSEELSSFEL